MHCFHLLCLILFYFSLHILLENFNLLFILPKQRIFWKTKTLKLASGMLEVHLFINHYRLQNNLSTPTQKVFYLVLNFLSTTPLNTYSLSYAVGCIIDKGHHEPIPSNRERDGEKGWLQVRAQVHLICMWSVDPHARRKLCTIRVDHWVALGLQKAGRLLRSMDESFALYLSSN